MGLLPYLSSASAWIDQHRRISDRFSVRLSTGALTGIIMDWAQIGMIPYPDSDQHWHLDGIQLDVIDDPDYTMDPTFQIIPRRDPLIFGASA